MMRTIPDYKKIYHDIILKICPEREPEFKYFLDKETLLSWDIVKLDNLIFNKKDQDSVVFNQRHRSYDDETILYIIKYQKEHKMNNSHTSKYFRISRNTLTKWKKIYKI
ncbi:MULTISPECIES: helix-turn-helix domain-containing protein [unclassified Chryseobacterium]